MRRVRFRQHPTARRPVDGRRHSSCPASIHIGIAVDTDAGLAGPRDSRCADFGLSEVATSRAILIERARAGKLAAADMQGGCFTVTNLGAFGIDAFTPIINYPRVRDPRRRPHRSKARPWSAMQSCRAIR